MRTLKTNKDLLLVVVFLLGLGLVQVFSSSFILATEKFGNGYFFIKKQFIFVALGLAVIFVLNKISWKYLKIIGVLLWIIAILGIAATTLTPLGVKVGGAYRWLSLPFGFRFEPAELLKVTYPFLIALILRLHNNTDNLKLKIFELLILLAPLPLLLRQPDFGTFVLCISVIFMSFFINGLKWRYVFGIGFSIVSAFYVLIIQYPYRYARIVAFMDPWADPNHKGFQIIQSMLSFYSGGISGAGLGKSQSKLFFLPEAHTDFTFAIFAEEWGIFGVFFLLIIFSFLIFKAAKVSMFAKDSESQNVAMGITLILALSIFVNLGVVMGLLPTKGLTLPFLSYGGSSLICMCFAIGVLLNIEKEQNLQTKRNKKKFNIFHKI